MQNSVGMAIKITEENYRQLAVVNGGVVPCASNVSDELDAYFVFPYDFNAHTDILDEKTFFETYQFANTPNETYFVDINKI